MVVTAIATYTRPNSALADVLLVGGVFGLVNIPSIAVWVGFGAALQRVLREPQTVRLFNWSMAALLVASIVPILRSQIPGP
jgi:threonine/homoserine/homoserine lactone efflux protein